MIRDERILSSSPFSVVTVVESEPVSDGLTALNFTCTISSITRDVEIMWDGEDQLAPDVDDITASTADVTIETGAYDPGTGTQESVLSIPSDLLQSYVIGDLTAFCYIQEDTTFFDSSTVELDVPSECGQLK